MKNERTRLMRRMERLAQCRVNDAVKLAFLDGEQIERIDGLDLGALTEFKRNGNGGVEVKLVDRAAVLGKLVELSDGQEDKAAEFFQALEQNAARPEESPDAV